MEIDLNKPFSASDVAKLLASKDDTANRQLRVTMDGRAFLSDVVGSKDAEKFAFVFETFCAGNGYTGPNAASDLSFASRIERALKDNWPNPPSPYIDFF